MLANLPDTVLLGGLYPQLQAGEEYATALDNLPRQEIVKLEEDGTKLFFLMNQDQTLATQQLDCGPGRSLNLRPMNTSTCLAIHPSYTAGSSLSIGY